MWRSESDMLTAQIEKSSFYDGGLLRRGRLGMWDCQVKMIGRKPTSGAAA
jgi:hypothetical protein